MRVSFIGYGNMAKALAKSIAGNQEYQLKASAPSLSVGVDEYNVATYSSNLEVAQDAEIIILAVKPKIISAVLTEIKPHLSPQCLLISIAAGVRFACLERYSPKKLAIVRGMPNLPVAVQKGATPLIANAYTSTHQKEVVTALFQNTGVVTWLKEEEELDKFTALSGSGPAYAFLFLEALISAGVKLGLSPSVAEAFSRQTLNGALALADTSSLSVQELRESVTSPGGTTAAALEVLQNAHFSTIIEKAIIAAYQRAKDLGHQSDV